MTPPTPPASFDSVVQFFRGMPLGLQVALSFAIATLVVLVVVATFYIIKYTLFLVYYILRSVVQAIRWAGKKCRAALPSRGPRRPVPPGKGTNARPVDATPRFCTRCGRSFPPASIQRIAAGYPAYCETCGERHAMTPSSATRVFSGARAASLPY